MSGESPGWGSCGVPDVSSIVRREERGERRHRTSWLSLALQPDWKTCQFWDKLLTGCLWWLCAGQNSGLVVAELGRKIVDMLCCLRPPGAALSDWGGARTEELCCLPGCLSPPVSSILLLPPTPTSEIQGNTVPHYNITTLYHTVPHYTITTQYHTVPHYSITTLYDTVPHYTITTLYHTQGWHKKPNPVLPTRFNTVLTSWKNTEKPGFNWVLLKNKGIWGKIDNL